MISPVLAKPIILVMGVAASGKTTIGRALAETLAVPFQEGDDLHDAANVAHMAAGIALTDADRAPWLARIGAVLDGWRQSGSGGVVTCSALKRAYRDQLRQGRPELQLVWLHGSRKLIAQRMAARTDHFMSPTLLDSQFATLEPPTPEEAAIIVEIDRPPASTLAELVARF
jgi:gluconokinase